MIEHDFDFDSWFQWKFRPYTRKGQPCRSGTFTIPVNHLITDLVYDFCASRKTTVRKNALTIVKNAIDISQYLVKDEKGYCLVGEPRVKFNELWRLVPNA